jgi:MIP family channel proteins
MNIKALWAEFFGVFALVFVGVGAIAANHIGNGFVGLTGIALAHGLALCCMVTAVAAISGGHFNPAVTIGLFSVGKIDSTNAIGYIVAQCLGGIVAAFLLTLSIPAETLTAIGMGTPAVNTAAGVTVGQAFTAEVILTFFLAFVIYGTAVDKRAPKMGGLFIGLTVSFDILMGGPISGAAMNPARHLGPALFGGGFANMWLYWVAPILGGVLGIQAYHHLVGGKKN